MSLSPNNEHFDDGMTTFGMTVVDEAERLLRQQVIGAVAAVVALAAFASFAVFI